MININYLIAMLLGIGGSFQLHISKCLQIIGLRNNRGRSLKHLPPVYIWGLVLSNTGIFWILFSNKFAPASVFTSMFGAGSIVLVIFARKHLHEKLELKSYIGLALLMTGTILLSLSRLKDSAPDYSSINYTSLTAAVVIVLGLVAFFYFRNKGGNLSGSGTIYIGILCGSMGSLDMYLKGVGQNLQNSTGMFPESVLAWTIFLSSLVFSSLSFLLSQWSFAKNVRATIFIPSFNISYIVYPIILDGFIFGNISFNVLSIAGLLLIILGTVELRNMGKLYNTISLEEEIYSDEQSDGTVEKVG